MKGASDIPPETPTDVPQSAVLREMSPTPPRSPVKPPPPGPAAMSPAQTGGFRLSVGNTRTDGQTGNDPQERITPFRRQLAFRSREHRPFK